MKLLLLIILRVTLYQTALAYAMTFMRRFGYSGQRIADFVTKAPGLDLLVSLFTWIPWCVMGLAYGWRGVAGSVLGEAAGMMLWIIGHELMNQEAMHGPRIVKVLNRVVGRWQNHLALWVTMIALPGFLIIRLTQVIVWPALIHLLRFPRYDQARWVNVSRQKFSGLVGHDLIWCLYCDWMTGLYSLGAEMLRNLESFWCPIQFRDGKKCDNCKLDFPDIVNGWVPADGNMQQVAETLQGMYGTTGINAWYGHPVRMTVHGRAV